MSSVTLSVAMPPHSMSAWVRITADVPQQKGFAAGAAGIQQAPRLFLLRAIALRPRRQPLEIPRQPLPIVAERAQVGGEVALGDREVGSRPVWHGAGSRHKVLHIFHIPTAVCGS